MKGMQKGREKFTNGMGMSLNKGKKEIEEEISKLKSEVKALSQRTVSKEGTEHASEDELSNMMKHMSEERERTNKMLANIMERITKMEHRLSAVVEEEPMEQLNNEAREIVPLSKIDTLIVEMAQAKGAVCADDVKALMMYRGRNAASARLNSLRKIGLLKRHQMGHKVYYMLDADKATKVQIISPPQ